MAELDSHDLAGLLTIDRLEDLQREAARMIRRAGFSGFLYAFVNPGDWHQTGFTALFNGYPDEWLTHYFRTGYAVVDPIPQYCFTAAELQPLVWTPDIYRSEPERAFAEDALGHGVGAGLTFPIRDRHGRWGGFSFSVDVSNRSAQSFVEHEVAWARLLAVCVHAACQRLAPAQFAPAGVLQAATQAPAVPLSPRERECLAWCAAGKSTWEIGRILAVSEWTVAFHMKNLRRKFGVSTREQMVARAIATGLIQP